MALTKAKSKYLLIILMLAVLVIGGVLGEMAAKVDFLWWLGYSQTFGITTPLQLNLSVIQLTFAVAFEISIASIMGMLIGICIYKIIC